MANKVIIGILILIVILVGGVGYYSYTLHQQIEELDNQLRAFEAGQTARVDAVSCELTKFRQETLYSIDAIGDKIAETLAEIDAIEEEIESTQNRVVRIEDEMSEIKSQVDILEGSITNAVTRFSRSLMDASEVYQKVSQATVRISNGQSTVGSGFILDTESHVVTAHHVIEEISQIYVILHNGQISKATIVGFCQISDIAVLKLEKNPFIMPPPLADSSQLRIGEPVVAIGSPLDLRGTLTAGIISQINRYTKLTHNSQNRWIPNLIQFDAAVNAGNSGCLLANADSKIIGIVVARIDPTEGDGIYYAVSSNKIKRVVTEIIAKGFFDYPWIGVGIVNITPQLVQDRALASANGVLVSEIFTDSPAEAAGLEVNDIIVSMDNVPVKDSADLTSYLGEFKSPGDLATIGLIRHSTKMELSIEIGKRQ